MNSLEFCQRFLNTNPIEEDLFLFFQVLCKYPKEKQAIKLVFENIHRDNHETVITSVICNNCFDSAFYLIKDLDANVNYNNGQILSFACCFKEGYDLVKLLLELGCDVHYNCEEPIRSALQNKQLKIAKLLIDYGALVNFAFEETKHSDPFGFSEPKKYYNENFLLVKACTNGDYDMAKLLIESGADVNKSDVLLLTIRTNNLEMIELLVDNGADIHFQNDIVLEAAITQNYKETVKYFLEKGCNPFGHDGKLLTVCYDNYNHFDMIEDVVKLLLFYQGKIKSMDVDKKELFLVFFDNVKSIDSDFVKKSLIFCAEFADTDLVKYLIENGANIHHFNDTVLDEYIINEKFEIVNYLMDLGCNISYEGDSWFCSCARGNIGSVKFLYENCDVKQFENYDVALYIAIKYEHKELVKFLLENGFDANIRNGEAISFVMQKGLCDYLELLLQYGATIKNDIFKSFYDSFTFDNIKTIIQNYNENVDINCIFLNMIRKCDIECVKYMIEYGVDISIVGSDAMINAVVYGASDIVKLLFDLGVFVNNTHIIKLVNCANKKVIELFIENGIDLSEHKNDLLLTAVKAYNIDSVKYLLEIGADPNNGNGTAFKHAFEFFYEPIVDIFMNYGVTIPYTEKKVFDIFCKRVDLSLCRKILSKIE